MKKKIIAILAISGMVLALSACSSSQTSDGSGDDLPAADAGTDAVPAETADAPSGAAGAPEAAASPSPDAPPSPGPESASVSPVAPTDNSAPVPAPAPAAVPDPAAANPGTPTTTAAAAEIAPAPSAVSDAAPAADQGDSGSYTVQRGDTLMKIAFENYGDLYKWHDIYEANRDKIKDPNLIVPGTVLKIAHTESNVAHNGEKYQIKQGDTLGTISNEVYGTPHKWKKIWHNNHDLIKDPNRIFAGFYLYYTLSPEDRDEMEKLHNTPAPMANDQEQAPQEAKPTAMTQAPAGDTRAPASVGTMPTGLVQPSQVLPQAQPQARVMPSAPSAPQMPTAAAAPGTLKPAGS